MSFDVAKFLRDEMGFGEAEVAQMLPNFSTPDRLKAWERAAAGAAEREAAAREREELTRKSRELEEASTRLNAELAEWAALEATDKTATEQMRASLHAAEQRVLKLKQNVETLATKAGIDPKTILDEAAPVTTTPTTSTVTPVDETKYVPRATYDAMAAYQFGLPAELMVIASEHRALTGKDFDPRPVMAEIRKRATNPKVKPEDLQPTRVWEELHNIPQLRTEREAEARAEELKQAEARGFERARTEAALPTVMPAGRHSPAFLTRNQQGQFLPRESHLKRPQPESTVRAAAAALATHKYRTQPAGSTT